MTGAMVSDASMKEAAPSRTMKPFCMSMTTSAVRAGSSAPNGCSQPCRASAARRAHSGMSKPVIFFSLIRGPSCIDYDAGSGHHLSGVWCEECDGAHEVFGLSDATELDFGEDAVAEGCVLEEGFGEGCFDEGGGDR